MVLGNPVWLMQSAGGPYYIFKSGEGDSSEWDAYAQGARRVTIGTDAINIASKSGSGTWVSVQFKTALDSILPHYSTLKVEFQFSNLGSGGNNQTKAFGIASALRTSQGDYSWNDYQTFVGSSTNTRVTLSLDVSSVSTGYFAFEGPMQGNIYNVWLE